MRSRSATVEGRGRAPVLLLLTAPRPSSRCHFPFKRRSPRVTGEGQGAKGVNGRTRLTFKRPVILKGSLHYAKGRPLTRSLLSFLGRLIRRGPPSTQGLPFSRKRTVAKIAAGQHGQLAKLEQGRPEGGRRQRRGQAICPCSLRLRKAQAGAEGYNRLARGRSINRRMRIPLRLSSRLGGRVIRTTERKMAVL